MKRLVITLMLIFSSIIFSQSNYEILPIKQHLNDIYIIRMLEGENIGLYSIIDSKGNLLTQTDNILISVQKNHIYLVTKDYKEGLMTTDGKWIAKIGEYNFKEKYSNMYKEAENNREKEFFIVYINEMPRHKYGYINYKGELQIPIIYDEAENFSEGLAAVKLSWVGWFFYWVNSSRKGKNTSHLIFCGIFRIDKQPILLKLVFPCTDLTIFQQ